MKKILLALFLTVNIGTTLATEPPTIQDRMNEQIQSSDDADDAGLCESKIKRYAKNVDKYEARERRTDLDNWKLSFYKDRLKHWQKFCSSK